MAKKGTDKATAKTPTKAAVKDQDTDPREHLRDSLGETGGMGAPDTRDEAPAEVVKEADKAAIAELRDVEQPLRPAKPKAPKTGGEPSPEQAATEKYADELIQTEAHRQPGVTPEQLAVEKQARQQKAREAALQAEGQAELEAAREDEARDPEALYQRAVNGEHVYVTEEERIALLAAFKGDDERRSDVRQMFRKGDLVVRNR